MNTRGSDCAVGEDEGLRVCRVMASVPKDALSPEMFAATGDSVCP